MTQDKGMQKTSKTMTVHNEEDEDEELMISEGGKVCP
jgi:hypothetical protein